MIYLIKVGTEARKRIANGNLVQKKSRVISDLSELKEEEFENLRKNNVKMPSYLFRNYIKEQQQLENQMNGYNSSSSSNSNSNPMYESPTSILNNENSPNQEMMTINNAISKYHSYDSSMNQRKSLFSTLSSFIPQFSGYEDSLYFKVPSNSLNYPKRMVNSLKNKYSDLENKMYSKMKTGLSKAYEVASSSNPMNFLLNSSDTNADTNKEGNNSNDNEDEYHDNSNDNNGNNNNNNYNENDNENDDDYDYDYETDTENYYCNNIARKSLSAASSIKSLSTSLSSSIIDNISYLKQSFDGSSGDKRSKSKTQSNKSTSSPSYDNNSYSKQPYEHDIHVQRSYSHNDVIGNNHRNGYNYNRYNNSSDVNNESSEALNKLGEDFEFNNSSRLLPFSGRHAILACLILCSKFYYDNDVPMIKNKFWQTFCGLSNNSLNYIQSKILDLLNYNLVIEADRFSRFAGVMLTYTHLKNKVFFSQPYLTYNRRSIHLNILTTIALSESEQLQSSLLKTVTQFKKQVKDCQSYLNNNKNNSSNNNQDNSDDTNSLDLKRQKENNQIIDNSHINDKSNPDNNERIAENTHNNYKNDYPSINENESHQDNNNKEYIPNQNIDSNYQTSNYNQNRYSKSENNYQSFINSYTQHKDEYESNVKSYNYMFKEPKSEVYQQENNYDGRGYQNYSPENISRTFDPPRRYSKNKGKEIDPSYLNNDDKSNEFTKPYVKERNDKYSSNYNTQQYNYNSNKSIPKKYNRVNSTLTSPIIRTQQLFSNPDSKIKAQPPSHSYHSSSPSHYSTYSNSSYSNMNNNSNSSLNKKYSSNLLFKRVDDSYHMDLWKSLVHNYYYEPNSENSNGDSSAYDSQSGQHSNEQIIFSNKDKQVLDKENYKLIKTDRNNVRNNIHMLESNFTAIDNEYFKMKSSHIQDRSNGTSQEESSGHFRNRADISIHNICSHDDNNVVAKIDRKDIENSKSHNYYSSQISNHSSEDIHSDYPSSHNISYQTPSNNISSNNSDKSQSSKSLSSSYNRYEYNQSKEAPNEVNNILYRINSTNSYNEPIQVKQEEDDFIKKDNQYNINNNSYNSNKRSYSNQNYELLNRNNKRSVSSLSSTHLESNSRVKMIKRELNDDYRNKPITNYSNNNNNSFNNDKDNSYNFKDQENESHSQYSNSYNKYNINVKKENKVIDSIHDRDNLKYNSYNNVSSTGDRNQNNNLQEENKESSSVFPSILLSPSESVKSNNSNSIDEALLTPKDMDLPDVLNSPSQPKKSTPYRRSKTSPFLTRYNNNNNNNNTNSFEYNQSSSSMLNTNSYHTEIRNYTNKKNYSTIRNSQPIFNNNDKFLNNSNYSFENNRKSNKSNNKMSISTIVDKL